MILEMSIKGAIVIVAVLLARLLLSKAPKKYSYLLWAAVAFRLCVPFSFSSDFSIFGLGNAFAGNEQTVITDAPVKENTGGGGIIIDGAPEAPITDSDTVSTNNKVGVSRSQILTAVWLTGTAVMLVYGAVSYIRIYRKMATATRNEGNVYCSEHVRSPFTLGLIKPKIYIPYGLDGATREKIIAHENCHINRFDHIIKPIAFLILAVHWFNPLCWIAFDRMSLDMEMSCDEKLLRTQGDEEMKKTYTNALLSFASNRRFPAPSPVNFNDGSGAKKRIKNALNYKKPKAWVTVLAYVFCALMLVACVADAKDVEYKDINKEIFADAPYVITYESNGDGTCTVTDIIVDYSYEGQITINIPAVSPDGDTVAEIITDFNNFKKLNVPAIITEKSFNEIKNKLKDAVDDERDLRRFISFYDPHENDGIYVLEPALIEEEYDKLSVILDTIGYTAQDAYDAAIEVVNTVPADSDEAENLRLEAFDLFYHNAHKVKDVYVSEDTSVKGLGNVNWINDVPIGDVEINDTSDNQQDANKKKTEITVQRSDIGNNLLFFSNQTVKEFTLHTLAVADYSDEGGFVYQIDETVYNYGFAWENRPVEIGLDYEVSDEFAISFVDVDGTTRYFRIYLSEYDSSYSLIELDIQ